MGFARAKRGFLHMLSVCKSYKNSYRDVDCSFSFLGADYMANFIPVSRAEISPRPPEQISLKRRLRLHGETFSPG